MLALLLEFNSRNLLNLEHEDQNGQTPLCVAVNQGSHHTVKLLLDAGANVNHVDSQSRTPLKLLADKDLAMWVYYQEVVRYLVNASAKLLNVLNELVAMRDHSDPHLQKAKYIIRCRILYEDLKPITDPIEYDMENLSVLKQYLEDCRAEIIILKNSSLHYSISYYDLLIADRKFHKRVRDKVVYEEFDEKVIEKRFPFYAKDLCNQFKRVKNEHDLWENSTRKLTRFLGFPQDAYYLTVRNILDRLQENDLLSLARC
ncbi:hypothetical protein QAD02_023912 [Eretmocerus hayati]|uniref:Uncharacterized protein n=1 Tax=Eretmocerus hayati TaxID=131215 RepID=A0ACC2PXC4_9HYME|nr:hypothetical protein QAD02_023912 [Eretmocerus hayati]